VRDKVRKYPRIGGCSQPNLSLIIRGMSETGATVPIIGTAHRVFGHLVFNTRADSGVISNLKRFIRLYIFLGTVALAVILGYELAGWIGFAIAFVLMMMSWTAVAACMMAKDPEE
jgi:hypothetical protein